MSANSRDPRIQQWMEHKASASPLPPLRNPTSDTYQYSNDALRALACPLGPCGGGCIAMAGDGGLRQWQISNRVAHDAHVPDSFFAIKTQDLKGNVKAVVLQSDTLYDQTGFTPAAFVTDHVVPPASVQLLKDLPGTKTVQATVKYPTFEMDYLSGETPVGIHLQALNPCIGLNSKDSGIPMIAFSFKVTNPTSDPLEVTMMQSQQNIAGWDGASTINNEVENTGYGGNINAMITMSGITALDMSNPTLQPADATNGHMAAAVYTLSGDVVSTLTQYTSHNLLWQKFTAGDLPGNGSTGPSPAGQTWNGALACRRKLAAGASTTFLFVLAWHFPNRYLNWSQAGFGIKDTKTEYWLVGVLFPVFTLLLSFLCLFLVLLLPGLWRGWQSTGSIFHILALSNTDENVYVFLSGQPVRKLLAHSGRSVGIHTRQLGAAAKPDFGVPRRHVRDHAALVCWCSARSTVLPKLKAAFPVLHYVLCCLRWTDVSFPPPLANPHQSTKVHGRFSGGAPAADSIAVMHVAGRRQLLWFRRLQCRCGMLSAELHACVELRDGIVPRVA